MQIEEIIRTCSHEQIASAAVSSIGRNFSREVGNAATAYGMSLGGFTTFAIERFARKGDESEMRAVRASMTEAQEPILAGLKRHSLLAPRCGAPAFRETRAANGPARIPDGSFSWDSDARREWVF